MDFYRLLKVYFLCKNLIMKNLLLQILNPYVSVSEKDILWEIIEMGEQDELSAYDQLRISANSTALSGQISTITKPISAGG